MSMIGENIKRYRLANGLTLEDVAKATNLSRQTIQRYESGVISNIPSDKIELIAKKFNVSPSVIMGWEKPEKNKGLLVCEEIQQYEKDSTQAEINKAIGELNQEGKVKVLEYAKDLQGTDRYKKYDKSGVG